MKPARSYARTQATTGVPWSRTWRDAAGRAVRSGSVQLVPVRVPGVVTAGVTIALQSGTASTRLAPGRYQLLGRVVTVDGDTVALPAEEITVS